MSNTLTSITCTASTSRCPQKKLCVSVPWHCNLDSASRGQQKVSKSHSCVLIYTRLDEWAQGAGPRREVKYIGFVWSKCGYHKARSCSSSSHCSAYRVVSMGQGYRETYGATMQVCLLEMSLFWKSMFLHSHLCSLECFHISSVAIKLLLFNCTRY